MEKNYYEILEVDRHASSDIIKKAYTTLAKKYHPDLQPDDQKEDAKKKLQKINEAYETLGNIEKKKIYDSLIEDSFVSKKEYDSLYVENQHLKQLLNETKEKYSQINTFNSSLYDDYINSINESKQQAYYDAYIQDLKNRGYKIKYKKTKKDYFTNFISFLFTILILFLLWQIPFIRNIITDNILFETISNLFKNIK